MVYVARVIALAIPEGTDLLDRIPVKPLRKFLWAISCAKRLVCEFFVAGSWVLVGTLLGTKCRNKILGLQVWW